MKIKISMSPYRFLFILTVYMCMTHPGKAQNNNSYIPAVPSITLPSPTSQAFQQFMGFQPELATGAVNVTIPLHTVNYNDFTLPFSLNYQSNGIKCSAPHYPLGYGWTFHPGLRITRTTLGNGDEQAPKKYHYSSLNPRECLFKYFEICGHGEDSMYDVFTLYLPQGQAHFIVEQTDAWSGKWEVITASVPYQIEPLQYSASNQSFRGFKVTDENGLIYYFGEESGSTQTRNYIERSRVRGSDLPSTYLLRKVELPGRNQQEILFEWNMNDAPGVQIISYQIDIDGYSIVSESAESSPDPPQGVFQEMIDGPLITGSALSKIILPNGTVNFAYDNDGLRYMSIMNGNNCVKHINFKITDRLLESVTMNNDEKYQFHYNAKRFGSIYEQDFWGYYNGAGSKNTFYTHPSYSYTILQYNSLRSLTGANRKPNNAYVDANILEQVDYPTGGYTRFEYEPHRYLWNNKIQTGGGLRVKRTTTANDTSKNGKPIIKTYQYGKNGCGYGKCSIEQNEDAFASELFYRHSTSLFDYSYRQTTVHPNSLYSGYLLFNLPIWYNDVTEYVEGNGKTDYEYEYEPDCLAPYQTENIHDFISDNYWKKIYYRRGISLQDSWQYEHIFDRTPRLIKKQIYNAAGTEKYKEEYSYNIYEQFAGKSLQNINYTTIFKDLGDSNSCYPYTAYDFLLSPISPRTYFVNRKTITENGVTTRTNYQYNHTKSYYRIETIHSDSTVVVEKFLYADDDMTGLPASCSGSQYILQNGHRNTLPICITKNVDGKTTGRKIIQYSDLYGNSMNYVYPTKEYFQMGDGPLEKRIEYSKHNKDGKPVEIKKDGQSSVYLWSYLSQYPVAKIANCTYDEVKSIIGQEFAENLSAAIAPTQEQWDKLHSLRALPDIDLYLSPHDWVAVRDQSGRNDGVLQL